MKKHLVIMTKDRDDFRFMSQFFSGKTYQYVEVTPAYGDILQGSADLIATAGNSYGMMDGGIDGSINYYLNYVDQEVRKYIFAKYLGECPVGSSFLIEVNQRCHNYHYLAYVPTMKVPCDVSSSINAYLAMRSLIILMFERKCMSCCLPLFCRGAGEMKIATICHQYEQAFQSLFPPSQMETPT